MKNNELTIAYVFDAEGWFNGTTAWQWCNGKYMKVPNTTLTQLPPKHLEGSFFRYHQNSNMWEEVPKPTPEECLGVRVDTSEGTLRVQYLTELLREYEKHEGYYVNREGGAWVLEKVPEPTQEEIEVEELNKFIEELERTVDTLCKRLQVAQLRGNTEEINKIKNEYKELTNGN